MHTGEIAARTGLINGGDMSCATDAPLKKTHGFLMHAIST
jgi:hypothetical protein